MPFTGTHHVTADDYAHAVRLAARRRDVVLSLFAAAVLVVILFYVGWAFAIYVRAAVMAPDRLLDFLRFETGGPGTGLVSWLSVLVALALPVFGFFAVRAFLEALRPGRRVRRLMRRSDLLGPTTYRIDDEGVRSSTAAGPETFLPWTSFDGVRSDRRMAILTRQGSLRFFVPFAALGAERDTALAHIEAHVNSGRSAAGAG